MLFKMEKKKALENEEVGFWCKLLLLSSFGKVRFLILDFHKSGQTNSFPCMIYQQPVIFEITL